ncbi:HNH endonuclease [Saccharopolyspora sp. K220]|uniref:HNH endonuclease signature motif containing protein n=1 Tax=Saccharopolyspora soli TaxID=2926618 RepID=UPI001F585661|nr:HNH endonuclease signature motif containing protein [Saccharopolyspora soli]MCI2416185.1 HNH endonuclease [Saccharopolyspora soli]
MIRETEAAMRAALATQVQAIAEAERRGLYADSSARKTEVWLQEMLNISPGEARSRTLVARRATPQATLYGETLPADLPATAEAIQAGAITVQHARVIIDGMARLAPICTFDQEEQAEAMLAGYATEFPPHHLARLAERLRYHFDQDGAFREEETQHTIRELHYGSAADGMMFIKARLDRETGAKFTAVIEPLAAPRPAEDGTLDPRTAAQRNADAFDAMLDITLRSDRLPRAGGQRPHLAITIDFDDLKRGLISPGCDGLPGTITTTGQPITADNARRLACDAEILPVLLGSDGAPLNVGRTERTAPAHLRAALLQRDDTCAFPSCDRPPGTPDAHHIVSWIDGGPTNLNNMVMLCGHHHRAIHNQHWQITIEHNRPIFIPPTSVDPTRKPRPGGRPRHQEHHTILRQAIPRPRQPEATPACP